MKRAREASAPLPPGAIRAKDRASFRRWLAQNHAKKSEVLLVYARKASGQPSIDWSESVDEALCFGWVDGVRGKLDDNHFTVRFTPRKATSSWSKRNLIRVAQLRDADLMHAAGLRAFEHGKQRGAHERAYAIREAVTMPSELEHELAKSLRVRAAFEALSPGQQKGWTRWVAGAKTAATRALRAHDAMLLIAAGRKASETDNQAARRGIASRAEILERARKRG